MKNLLLLALFALCLFISCTTNTLDSSTEVSAPETIIETNITPSEAIIPDIETWRNPGYGFTWLETPDEMILEYLGRPMLTWALDAPEEISFPSYWFGGNCSALENISESHEIQNLPFKDYNQIWHEFSEAEKKSCQAEYIMRYYRISETDNLDFFVLTEYEYENMNVYRIINILDGQLYDITLNRDYNNYKVGACNNGLDYVISIVSGRDPSGDFFVFGDSNKGNEQCIFHVMNDQLSVIFSHHPADQDKSIIRFFPSYDYQTNSYRALTIDWDQAETIPWAELDQ